MSWVEHVSYMVGKTNVCKILSDNLKRKIMWEIGNGMYVTKPMPGGWGLGSSCSGLGSVAGSHDYSNESSGSIKDGEFIEELTEY